MSISISDKNKFVKIYTKNYSRLYYYALSLVSDSDVSKDIVNDVFVGLWCSINKIEIENVNAYLKIAIRHKIVDYLRKNKLQNQYNEYYLNEVTLFYFDDEEDDECEKDKLVEKMLTQLQPPTRTILEMCYLKRMKYAEVAKILGISPATVKKHISKALKILREYYNNTK
jgi:RNA polymerase sigma-70 factor (family 1)